MSCLVKCLVIELAKINIFYFIYNFEIRNFFDLSRLPLSINTVATFTASCNVRSPLIWLTDYFSFGECFQIRVSQVCSMSGTFGISLWQRARNGTMKLTFVIQYLYFIQHNFII